MFMALQESKIKIQNGSREKNPESTENVPNFKVKERDWYHGLKDIFVVSKKTFFKNLEIEVLLWQIALVNVNSWYYSKHSSIFIKRNILLLTRPTE